MTARVVDVLCGAVSALIATAVTVGVSSYEWTPERLLAHEAAQREGPYATAPVPEPTPATPAVRAAGRETPAGPLPAPADPEQVWLTEMRRAGVPDDALPWMWGQIHAESRWRPEAVSPVGARGMQQAMPRTWAANAGELDPSCEGVSPHDPECGARFQAHYVARVRGWLPPGARTDDLTAVAYNAGIGRTKKALAACGTLPGCSPRVFDTVAPLVPRESRRYAKAIVRYSREQGVTALGELGISF